MANGVATVVVQSGSRNYIITTQKGAESVTNPTGNATPEVVSANVYGFGSWKEVQQRSSLMLLGETVMTWEEDYDDLIALLETVTTAWAAGLPSGTRFSLDFEFKKALPGKLEVKQVRPIPLPSTTPNAVPWLLPSPAPVERCILQGENSTVLGLHRAKAIVSLSHRGLALQSRALDSTFWSDWQVATTRDGQPRTFGGDPTRLPGFWHRAPDLGSEWPGPIFDGFEWTPNAATETIIDWSIQATLPWRVSAAEVPLLTFDDAWTSIHLEYDRELFDPDYWDGGMTAEAMAVLGPCPEAEVITEAHTKRELVLNGPNGLSFDIRFWWPPPPKGIVAGYTAPLARWDRTVISGLTEEPIELQGYWSQTYRPGHHNFTEAFVFEPRLEEGIDRAVLDELLALDVVALRVESSWEEPIIHAMDANGRWRLLQGPNNDR